MQMQPWQTSLQRIKVVNGRTQFLFRRARSAWRWKEQAAHESPRTSGFRHYRNSGTQCHHQRAQNKRKRKRQQKITKQWLWENSSPVNSFKWVTLLQGQHLHWARIHSLRVSPEKLKCLLCSTPSALWWLDHRRVSFLKLKLTSAKCVKLMYYSRTDQQLS